MPFVRVTLERAAQALALIGLVGHAQAVHRRYLDFRLVEGELDLEFAEHAGNMRGLAKAV